MRRPPAEQPPSENRLHLAFGGGFGHGVSVLWTRYQ
jgi:hypothetical protein